jgi:hypothetical protein
MRALSIPQPYAELILRGIKAAEYRSRATAIIGERFHIYTPPPRLRVRRNQPNAHWADCHARWRDEDYEATQPSRIRSVTVNRSSR